MVFGEEIVILRNDNTAITTLNSKIIFPVPKYFNWNKFQNVLSQRQGSNQLFSNEIGNNRYSFTDWLEVRYF